MQELWAVANSEKGWAAQRAQMALGIGGALERGEISKDEARELLEDLVRTDKLDAEADDMHLKAMLVIIILLV